MMNSSVAVLARDGKEKGDALAVLAVAEHLLTSCALPNYF